MKRLAKYLHILSEGLPVKTKRLGLLLFCFLWTLCCLHTIIFPMTDVVKVTPIRQLIVFPHLSEPPKSSAFMHEEAIRKIRQFRRMAKDSNISVSPGLMDSLSYLETLSQSQKNND